MLIPVVALLLADTAAGRAVLEHVGRVVLACTSFCPTDAVLFDIAALEVLHARWNEGSHDVGHSGSISADNEFPMISADHGFELV